MNLCSVLNLFFTLNSCADPSNSSIKTAYGTISGYDLTHGSISLKAYEGIPYAQPIKPSKRFEKSQLPTPWKERTLAADSKRAACHGRMLWNGQYSEDCLYLDIYTPSKMNNLTLLPVVVYLANELDYAGSHDHQLAFRLVPQQIILVTVQYRNGPLGFLSVPELESPSNIGLWDSNLALRFLKDTLISFGGDADKITLMGQGLASVLTSAHAVSPQSNKLISQTIEMSGSIWSVGSHQAATFRNSRKLIDSLNCSMEDNDELMNCLRNLTVQELLSKTNNMSFGPVIDEEFLPAYPEILVEEAVPVRSLTSVTKYGYKSRELFKASPSSLDDFNEEILIDYVRDQISSQYENQFSRAEKEIFKQYIPFTNMTSVQLFSQFLKLVEDISSNVPIAREIEHRTKKTADCFLMYWDYSSTNQFDSNSSLKGSYFGQELAYLNDNFAFSPFEFSKEDVVVQKLFLNFLIQFIKSGDPSTADYQWSSYNGNQTYLRMNPNPEMDEDLFETPLTFWKHMSKYGKDIISGASTDLENMESKASEFKNISAFLVLLNILFFINH